MSRPLGFIGLGLMGKPMAKNLLAAGFPLTVYNRSRQPMEELRTAGARGVTKSREVAEASEVVITMLPDSPDVEDVILGPGGVIEGIGPGKVVIDMSTILPRVSRRIAEALAKKGAAMLDAPVSGGPTGAEAGTLSIMVGGPEKSFRECLPIFETMGKKIVWMGKNGAGHMAKLCNQIVCVLNLAGLSEMLVFGAKAGLEPERLLEAVGAGAGASWMLSNQGPRMLQRDFAPGFFVRLQQKDLRLVIATAEELGVPVPGTSLVQQLFRVLEAQDKAELGTQALLQVFEQLAQCTVSKSAS